MKVFYDLMIGFSGGVIALGFYQISDMIWKKILSFFYKMNNSDKNEK